MESHGMDWMGFDGFWDLMEFPTFSMFIAFHFHPFSNLFWYFRQFFGGSSEFLPPIGGFLSHQEVFGMFVQVVESVPSVYEGFFGGQMRHEKSLGGRLY